MLTLNITSAPIPEPEPKPAPKRRRGAFTSVNVPFERLPQPYMLSVPCTYCGADIRQPCRSAKTQGKPTTAMHNDRIAAVKEAAIVAVVTAAAARLDQA